jgi:hypothetical protein
MNNDLSFSPVDTLGNLLAQIADLEAKAEKIKDQLKNNGKTVEGVMYKATYIEANRSSTNWVALFAAKTGVQIGAKDTAAQAWSKIAVKFGFEAEKELPQAIADNTTTTAVFSIKVTAR